MINLKRGLAMTDRIKKSIASVLFSATLLVAQAVSAQAGCDDNDIDKDDNGLIELCFVEDLDAMRYGLDGTSYQVPGFITTSTTRGCASGGCRGYELVRDLDFQADDSYRSTANKVRWTATGTTGWLPIGDSDNDFSGDFVGNGYTLSNLTIIQTTADNVGLFGQLSSSGTITGLSLLNVAVRGNDQVGSLVGRNYGTITNSDSSGQVAGRLSVGGLVGRNEGRMISNSHSSVSVSGFVYVGGLVGYNEEGTISNSYSIGQASGSSGVGGLVGINYTMISNSYSTGRIIGIAHVGGLVGANVTRDGGTVSNSYSIGRVSGDANVGGLVGSNIGGNKGAVNDSYWDIVTSRLLISSGGTSKTTTELQTPMSTTGIYSAWSEDDWYFGTADEYPAISYTPGTDADNPACGTSQQPACDNLLAGQGRILLTVSTQTLRHRADAIEGDIVVLKAAPGIMIAGTTQTEFRFVVSASQVGREAVRAEEAYDVEVSDGTITRQITVLIMATKIRNGNIVLEPIVQNGNDLTAPMVDLLSDPDGAVDVSSISYQWQKCLVGEDCSDEANWSDTGVATRLYSVAEADARRNNRFRVVVRYRDGQGYAEQVTESITYAASSVSPVPIFTGDWSEFEGGAVAVCNDADIDNDNDGLIEICHLEDLDAVRHVPDGSGYQPYSDAAKSIKGCGPDGCNGYELVRDLDFEADDSYLSTVSRMRWTTGSGWIPIASFHGTFDGNGYILSGLMIDRTSRDVGLFSRLVRGVVRDIGLLNADVRGGIIAGSLVGQNYQGTISNSYSTSGQVSGDADVGGLVGVNTRGTISKSYSSGLVSGNSGNNFLIGGLVGYNNEGTIGDSHSNGSVRGKDWIGGLVGDNKEGMISHCYSNSSVRGRDWVGSLAGGNSGTISNSYSIGSVSGVGNRTGGLVGLNGATIVNSYSSSTVNGNALIGGLVGVVVEGRIINSYSNGLVSSNSDTVGGLVGYNDRGTINNSYSSGLVRGTRLVGGLVGFNSSGSITNSYSARQVRASRYSVGGLVGYNKEGTISNSYNIGAVSGEDRVGGLVGYNDGGTITNSYSSGLVNSAGTAAGGLVGQNGGTITNGYSIGSVNSAGTAVGGLVGQNGGTITNSYSIGSVSGTGGKVGGLVGEKLSGATVRASYWDIMTSKLSTSAGGTSKTTVQLQTPTTASGIYSQWSENDWDFGTTVQYPVVKYATGVDANNPACGTLQQPACGSVLGPRLRQIAISAKVYVRTDAVEGETVTLDAYQGNFNYSWAQTTGTQLSLGTTNTAELRFIVPSDFVGKEATTGSLMFQLTVSTGTMSMSQTVLVVVNKINNDTIVLGSITQSENTLAIPLAELLLDVDGAVSARYQWQLCLIAKNCSSDSTDWTNTSGTSASYSVPEDEARTRNRFRVVVDYSDGQGYETTLISDRITYFVGLVSTTPSAGVHWSQFVGGAKAVCNDEDIDNDNDGLIELCHLEDVDAIRRVSDGSAYQFFVDEPPSTQGCGPDGCRGYELVRDLDFAADDSYLSTANQLRWTTASGWLPIGDGPNTFSGIFEGNGNTLSNLKIDMPRNNNIGLFSRLESGGTINGISLFNIDIRGRNWVGSLVGQNRGAISNSYSIGRVAGDFAVGGLVGWNGGDGGAIRNSYSIGRVTAGTRVGGLVGLSDGRMVFNTISNSYSNGQVTGSAHVGGLVGRNEETMISNSYSVGQVTANFSKGGLVGSGGPAIKTTASYWDITTSKLATSIGGTSKTTTELQTPTTASGIYSQWSKNDWDFGTDIQYPTVKYTTGTDANNLACGTSQQPACGSLLGLRIRRVAISTKTLVRVDAVEGEMVVLDAYQGNFNYSWAQTSDTHLPLRTTNTAELYFVVPNDFAVGEAATTGSLRLQLTVSAGTTSTKQTVHIVVAKVDNGLMSRPTIIRSGNSLMVEPRLRTDPDGIATIEAYQWQRCSSLLASGVCSSWEDVSMDAFYLIPREDTVAGHRFRVRLRYTDGQGYRASVTSVASALFTYQKPEATFLRLKLFLEGALQ